MQRTGRCLCETVSYTAKELSETLTVCHCDMCRRWAGGPFLAIGAKTVAWQGEENIQVLKTSDWAERGFCSRCGSGLFYRLTVGEHAGNTSLAFGTLDDQSGLSIKVEVFIDSKPGAYALAGENHTMTGEQVMAFFQSGGD